MNEFLNFKDAWIVAQDNMLWMILALVLGIIVGWVTCARKDNSEAEG